MDEEKLSYKIIKNKLMDPSGVGLPDVKKYYLYLSSIYAQSYEVLGQLSGIIAQIESKYIEQGLPANQARTMTNARDEGRAYLLRKAELKGMEEVIRALKKAQFYGENDYDHYRGV